MENVKLSMFGGSLLARTHAQRGNVRYGFVGGLEGCRVVCHSRTTATAALRCPVHPKDAALDILIYHSKSAVKYKAINQSASQTAAKHSPTHTI